MLCFFIFLSPKAAINMAWNFVNPKPAQPAVSPTLRTAASLLPGAIRLKPRTTRSISRMLQLVVLLIGQLEVDLTGLAPHHHLQDVAILQRPRSPSAADELDHGFVGGEAQHPGDDDAAQVR